MHFLNVFFLMNKTICIYFVGLLMQVQYMKKKILLKTLKFTIYFCVSLSRCTRFAHQRELFSKKQCNGDFSRLDGNPAKKTSCTFFCVVSTEQNIYNTCSTPCRSGDKEEKCFKALVRKIKIKLKNIS